MNQFKVFNIDKKYCFKVSLVYFASVLFANFMAQLLPVTIDIPVAYTADMLVWKNFVDSNEILINSLTIIVFLIPSIICIKDSLSILHAKEDIIAAQKVVNLPIKFSLLGILGWILSFILEVIFCIYAKFTFNINLTYILFSTLVFIVLESIFSFVVSYFVTETVNRSAVLPRLFPEGKVSKIPGVKKFSLNFLFIFFFVTVSVFPIIFILSSFVSVQINNQIPINWNTIKISIILFASSLALTIVFMRIFTVPLTKLIAGTEKITNGDYSVKVKNISNDELGVLSDTFNEMAESLKEKEFIRDTFGKVVDPEIRDHLLSGNISLGGENCDVTVMFCDIRGFTSLSENMQPEVVVNLLNQYFTQMEKCISKNHGVINKYIGDAVMAIFGAPVKTSNHAFNAYNAALEMKKSLTELNKIFTEKKLPQLAFGVGLHSGVVLAGNIGAENRMEYTVIGDTVNTASRIESLCKKYNTDFLISESTFNKIVKNSPEVISKLKYIDQTEIRGKIEEVKLYTW